MQNFLKELVYEPDFYCGNQQGIQILVDGDLIEISCLSPSINDLIHPCLPEELYKDVITFV